MAVSNHVGKLLPVDRGNRSAFVQQFTFKLGHRRFLSRG
jgi:hypothetical protein